MATFKKILVAIGFTPYSQGIFNFAAKIAEAAGTDLLVASIINTRDVETVSTISALGYTVDGEHYISAIREERMVLLDKIIVTSGFAKEKVHSRFIMGNPIDELLKLCVTEDVEMIVMGTKGRTDLETIFIGSVAEKIFRRAPVTVVSYRDENQAAKLKKRIHLN
ncbi:MAG: universal stress protein [Desulfobacterales bacterium]|nr:universal stress protein [Desulfobacterales bacterium]